MTIQGDDGRVEFRFYRPGVSDVRVVGDFSGGSTTLPMQCDDRGDHQGWWSAKATFNGGEYRFRYVADGTWYTDFASNGVELAKHGFDSILVIPERRIKEKQITQSLVA
jgi:1,4-alpha-glucan branching enzyme